VEHTLLNGNRDTGGSLVLDTMVSIPMSGDGNSEAEDNGEELHRDGWYVKVNGYKTEKKSKDR